MVATREEEVASKSIIINQNGEYDLVFRLRLYIVKNGIALVNIESVRYAGATSGNIMEMSYADGVATLHGQYSSGDGANWRTNTVEAIDVTPYESMVLKINSANKKVGGWAGIANLPTYGNNPTYAARTDQIVISTPQDFTVDLSNNVGNLYLGYFGFVGSTMGNMNINFTDWYLIPEEN